MCRLSSYVKAINRGSDAPVRVDREVDEDSVARILDRDSGRSRRKRAIRHRDVFAVHNGEIIIAGAHIAAREMNILAPNAIDAIISLGSADC